MRRMCSILVALLFPILVCTLRSEAEVTPQLSSISPSVITAGAGSFTLTVYGSSFIGNAIVLWNGSRRATNRISESQMEVQLQSSDIAEPGLGQVVVANYYPQAPVTSNSMTVQILSPAVAAATSFLTITTGALAGAAVGIPYVATLSASGGAPPYTWTVSSGQLPDGISLASSTGTISGTPAVSGTFTFTVNAFDSTGATASSTFTINVTSGSSSSGILWSADFENAGLTKWYYPSTGKFGNFGGGEYDSGTPGVNGLFSVASPDVAHSGLWSDKLSITTPSTTGHSSGTRMFRWLESRNSAYFASGLYYSVWLYIPQLYTVNGPNQFWNLFQFKSKHPCSSGTCTDPFWFLNVQNRIRRTASPMYLQLTWWCGLTIPGPFQGDGVGCKNYQSSVKQDLPVGKWIHLEAYLKQNTATNGSDNYDGRLTIWQDGVLLFDMVNVETKYADGDQQWSVNLYSDGLVPNPSYIYIDDAAESTTRIGP